MRSLNFTGETTLKRIEPHRFAALAIEDRQHYQHLKTSQSSLLLVSFTLKGFTVGFSEFLERAQQAWLDEIEQAPQVYQIIFNRSPRASNAEIRLELFNSKSDQGTRVLIR